MTSALSQSANAPLDPDALAPALKTLLHLAKGAGATAADAIATEGRSLSIGVRESELEDVDHSEGRDIGLRVFVGQRQACVSTSNLAPDTLSKLAERAVAMARLAPEDPYCGLPDPQHLTNEYIDLDLFDPCVQTADDLLAQATILDRITSETPGILQVEGASASATSSAICFATTDGFCQGWRSSRHNISVSALAEKDGHMERDYDYDGARWLSDVRSPESVARTAAARALARLGAAPILSTTLPVIFDRRVSGSLLSALISAISGPSITRGTSFLKAHMGKALFKPEIRISDNPLMARGHGSRPWDGEGLAARPCNLIENGTLSTWILNSSSARQLGLKSTAHAHRTIGAPPGVASTNVVLSAGTISRDAMIAAQDTALLVTEMFGPSLNGNTGDYSVGVSGFMIRAGEIAEPVSEITVAGNLMDIYAGLTPADDLVFNSATVAPSVLIESLTIAGR